MPDYREIRKCTIRVRKRYGPRVIEKGALAMAFFVKRRIDASSEFRASNEIFREAHTKGGARRDAQEEAEPL